MKSKSTTFIRRIFSFLIAFIIVVSFANSAPKRVVLLEEFTGTWCGPCGAYGKPMMAQILEAHPDDVIGVEVHMSDLFSINECSLIAGAMGVSGIPCASVDRTYNLAGTGAMVGYVNSWTAMVTAALAVPPKVDVKLYYVLNKSSRNLTCNIEANFVAPVSGDIRFNVIITEDDLIADQAGATPNYHHKHVLRDMLGDAFGTSGIISSNVSTGQNFKHTYSYTIPAGWNLDNLHFIGVVQEYNAQYADVKKILNCVEGIEGQPDMEFTCTTGPQCSAVGIGQTCQREFEIKNLTNTQRTYNINVTTSSRTPSNWNATVILPSGVKKSTGDGVLTQELIIGPLGNKTVTLQLTPGDMKGIGDAEISVKEKGNPSATEGKGSITAVSAEIDKFQVVDDEESGNYSLGATITNSGNNGYFDINSSDFMPIYNQFNKLNNVVWTCGEEGTVSDEEAATLKAIINSGTPVLISGATIVNSLDAALPNLLNTVGCSFQSVCRQGQGNGNINLIGYANDPITNGFDRALTLKKYLTFGIEINNPKTFPILRHKFVDTIVAVRSELASARVVLLGINPMIITNMTARNNLIGNAIKWLNGIGPKIASSVNELDFGDVSTQSQKDLTFNINNTGEEALNVSEMSVEWEYSQVFTIESPTDFPFIVQPGESKTVTVRFKPQVTFSYVVPLTIKSNAVNKNEIIVSLKGNGINAGDGPKIETNLQSVDFEEVPINNPMEKIIEVSNTGEQSLSITSINIVSDFFGIFQVISPATFPVSVSPGNKADIKVKFSPALKQSYNAVMEINSNAVNKNKVSVTLSGVGGNPVGVQDEEGNSITMIAGPNPFNAKTTISYTITGNGGMVEISVIDARGTLVANVASKNLSAGEYSEIFDAKGLSSGVYYLIGRINGKAMQLPIVIER